MVFLNVCLNATEMIRKKYMFIWKVQFLHTVYNKNEVEQGTLLGCV